MTVIAFLLGLAIGIGLWFWRQTLWHRQMQQMLDLLETGGAEGTSLPIASRLRMGISLVKQQRQQQELLLQSWQQLLELAPIGYLHIDEDNQLIWCNHQARQLLQIYRWESAQVRLLLEVVRSYELDQLIEETRQQQHKRELEWLFHPAYTDAATFNQVRSPTSPEPQVFSKSSNAIALKAYTLPLPQGQVGVFIENRQPLVELSRSRDRWVSDLAHELRTPLTSIRLVTENLQGRLQPPFSRWVEQMLPEINRLINLVQDFLELTHLEQDPSKYLHLTPVDLGELIDSVWQKLEPLTTQKQLSLLKIQPKEIVLYADSARLTQVFLNLFDNSIKYSPIAGTICCEINLLPNEDAAEIIQINIIDSGGGFAETDLPYVFDRLYRGEPSRNRQQLDTGSSNSAPVSTGSGLGLAIVKQIILAHDGSIQAKNDPQTGGALIQIELPLT